MSIQSQSILAATAMHSVLATESELKPKGERKHRTVVADLLLTALIDAFSILVIFLLMSFSSTGEILYINKMELPKAAKAEVLERNPVMKLEEGKLYLEDQLVTDETIVAALLDLRKAWSETHPNEEYPGILTIQADRREKFAALNNVVVAASQTGFSDIRFAVVIK